MPRKTLKTLLTLTAPALLALAGCGNAGVAAFSGLGALRVASPVQSIDTNCAGCTAVNTQGQPAARFAASLMGETATVSWTATGGDPVAGAGSIDANGLYRPPSFLTGDQAAVTLTARMDSGLTASQTITVRPGFLQPLSPQNAALGAGGSTTVSATLAEAGGAAGVGFALAASASGEGAGQGSLSATHCQRSTEAYTVCTAQYTAPANLAASGATYVVATAPSGARLSTTLLLNQAGIASLPTSHQSQQHAAILLGSSGGSNADFDARAGRVSDCCGGTLGALVQDAAGHQYLLGNNHVLARSDRATAGELIVQPGLIDNGCTPYGEGPGTRPVATLTGWLPLRSNRTNADAALAQVASGTVDPSGSILELGLRQTDGTLAAAPPGISSSNGRGETASLHLQVAKSGRTTGLTCGRITSLHLDVRVDYFADCAETRPYLSKLFTNQIGLSGSQFADAGDSGALVVDAANAEPVGLYFAGGLDAGGQTQGIATPAPALLDQLASLAGPLSFVGTADHPVSCLDYGGASAPLAIEISGQERARALAALTQARMNLSARPGILGLALGQSLDRPGEAALIVYVDAANLPAVPATLEGLRTIVLATTARAVTAGMAPKVPQSAALSAETLTHAVHVKDQLSASLLAPGTGFFGLGVGQSLDQPREAALVVYVDHQKLPATLPATLGGLRTRYILMDRLHVTRAYATPAQSRCLTRR